MNQTALLIDITSIQKYIFASNKLKENLGASYLVSDVYEKIISKNSKINDLPIKIPKNGYEGYIGGGNALFLFEEENGKDKEKAKTFVKEWTRSLLVQAPGITVSSAIGDWNGTFENDRKALFDNLTVNKSKFFSQAITQRHGISAESSSDGYSMDVWDKSVGEYGEYVSASTKAKLIAYKAAKEKIEEEFKDLLKKDGEQKYCFTGDLENLGQSKGSENNIAIVHIDGNSMGERFRELTSLEETKKLSNSLKEAVKNSFSALLVKIKEDIIDPKTKDYLKLKEDNGKTALPIRPIILGGDDITFVCEGRMGVYYAKIFMEKFAQQKVSDEKPLTSCAGIAVTKTKYPFYKGYQLAEELCANAKSKRLEMKDDGSWLDFHIAYGGFSGSLSEIRDLHYRAPLGSLIYRPYKLGDNTTFGFDTLIENVKGLNAKYENGKRKYPNNKLKELREVLTLGEDAALTFVSDMNARSEMNARNPTFPGIKDKKYNTKLFDGEVTPYFDMLEMLEYYPEYELQGGTNGTN